MGYSGNENGGRGIAAFYAAVIMPGRYKNPDNPWIIDSSQVQRDFLGGTPEEVPERYNADSPLFYVTKDSLLHTLRMMLTFGTFKAKP